jgi:phosphoserine aminotransferase
MKKHVHNFNAGPSVLPKPVLKEAQAELLDYHGLGMSIMEMSHRSQQFSEMISEAEANLRQLMDIPENYKTPFLQGGASLQFSMAPMNLIPPGGSADYIINGTWGQKAIKEAQKFGVTRVAASTADFNFDRLPAPKDLDCDPQASYVHFTSNETIQGVQWPDVPNTPAGVPVVCDMSSDILSRPLDVAKYGLIFAGAQKNAGPSGVTLVIIREDLLERVPDNVGSLINYRLLAEKNSLFNTPPSFAIYMVGLVLRWLVDLGGLPAIAEINKKKAGLLYQAIDDSGGFYRGHAQPQDRSLMNVTFTMESAELEKAFVTEALEQGMVGLKGHRSVGGLRASIYNACPLESVETLVDFMADFQARHG